MKRFDTFSNLATLCFEAHRGHFRASQHAVLAVEAAPGLKRSEGVR